MVECDGNDYAKKEISAESTSDSGFLIFAAELAAIKKAADLLLRGVACFREKLVEVCLDSPCLASSYCIIRLN